MTLMIQTVRIRRRLLRHVPLTLVAVLVGCVVPITVWAQSRLPPCPADQRVYYNNCFGIFTLKSGATYVGDWQDDKLHGQGTTTYPSGDTYIGGYRDNMRNGSGTFIFKDGSKYVGEFRDDQRNGSGTYIFKDGSKYVGEFRDDQRNGSGTIYNANGSVHQSGLWSNNIFTGPNRAVPNPPASAALTNIPLIKDGGTFKVRVLINGIIPLHFTVDSGAADVTIPADVVMTLVRAGTISDNDFLGDRTYILADGSRVKSSTFRIRQLKVGDRVVENVLGSVADVKGSLLLGQSFLSRFKAVKFDYPRQMLVLE